MCVCMTCESLVNFKSMHLRIRLDKIAIGDKLLIYFYFIIALQILNYIKKNCSKYNNGVI